MIIDALKIRNVKHKKIGRGYWSVTWKTCLVGSSYRCIAPNALHLTQFK